jgi:hypothetical protein
VHHESTLAAAHAEFAAWLTGLAGTAVHVGAPEATGAMRLCAWPVALVADQGTRGGYGQRVLRLRARHAVYCDGPLADALPLLDAVLAGLAADERYPLVPGDVPSGFWGAGAPRPALLVDVPVQVAASAAPAPRVRADLRHDLLPMRTVTGSVVTADGVTLAGITVTSGYSGASVLTDDRGRFALAGQPAGRAVTLQLSGRGLRFQAEVGAGPTDPVVVRCPDPSEEEV